MKKIFKTTELNWECSYCGFLNKLSENTCQKCGAIRTGSENEKEITIDFRKTTSTETNEFFDSTNTIQDKNNSINIILKFVFSFVFLVIGIYLIMIISGGNSIINKKSDSTNSNTTNYYTVINKEWEYTISIGKLVTETSLTSYNKPPKGATNVTTHQVQQDNGWYKTEYVYDYTDWKIYKTKTITGNNDIPTFKEYQTKKGEKVLSTTNVHFTITVKCKDKENILYVSEEKWVSYSLGKSYPEFEFF